MIGDIPIKEVLDSLTKGGFENMNVLDRGVRGFTVGFEEDLEILPQHW